MPFSLLVPYDYNMFLSHFTHGSYLLNMIQYCEHMVPDIIYYKGEHEHSLLENLENTNITKYYYASFQQPY